MTSIFNTNQEDPMMHVWCKFGIPAQICDELSCGQGKAYGQTDGRTDADNNTPFGLKGQGVKTIGHLSYAASSCVHHFIAMGEFKLELQSRNSRFGSKSAIFVPCDLEIWKMTLKNNRAPLLCCIKLCASFHSYGWIQTDFTVRKCSIRVKIGNFLFRVILKFEHPWKTIGHLSYADSSFVDHFLAIGEFKLELQSGNAQFGSKSMIF